MFFPISDLFVKLTIFFNFTYSFLSLSLFPLRNITELFSFHHCLSINIIAVVLRTVRVSSRSRRGRVYVNSRRARTNTHPHTEPDCLLKQYLITGRSHSSATITIINSQNTIDGSNTTFYNRETLVLNI